MANTRDSGKQQKSFIKLLKVLDSMWNNFKSMPFFMKLLAFHGSMFFVGAFFSLLPVGSFIVDRQAVSYSEWWFSGSGIEFFLVAFSIGVGALCILKKVKYARAIYFGSLIGNFASIPLSNPEILGRADWLMTLIIFLSLIYWYLFHKKTVQSYFSARNL
jgi:hypothetical protein